VLYQFKKPSAAGHANWSLWSHTPSKMLKSIAVAIALSLLAAIGAAILGAIAVNTLPCSWFGSGFEGGCGLGAVLFVSAASVLLAVVLAITFNVLYFRKKASRAEA
jgi:ABC-type phosphate/phosphonate transport system permease subunit